MVNEPHKELLRIAYSSVAVFAVAPMQDLLGLGAAERMNIPGSNQGNWNWRLQLDQLTQELAYEIKSMTEIYGRFAEEETADKDDLNADNK